MAATGPQPLLSKQHRQSAIGMRTSLCGVKIASDHFSPEMFFVVKVKCEKVRVETDDGGVVCGEMRTPRGYDENFIWVKTKLGRSLRLIGFSVHASTIFFITIPIFTISSHGDQFWDEANFTKKPTDETWFCLHPTNTFATLAQTWTHQIKFSHPTNTFASI